MQQSSISDQGAGLIFLISQPRAGSTLLQKILANHDQIHTLPEPWIMLQAVGNSKKKLCKSRFNERWASLAVNDFLTELPGGESIYFNAIGKMGAYLYNCAMQDTDKTYFLDKTPRYYYIIPELVNIFPEAHFIILVRNPLAVLCSIVTTWIKIQENWSFLSQFRDDLIEAPEYLLEGINALSGVSHSVVSYESIVEKPEVEIRRICNEINIDYSPDLLTYSKEEKKGFGYSEQTKAVHRSGKPQSGNSEKWIEELRDPQVWRVAKDYIKLLGSQHISNLGYSYEKLDELIHSSQPSALSQASTIPLSWMLDKPKGMNKVKYDFLRLSRNIQKQGITDTVFRLRHRLIMSNFSR